MHGELPKQIAAITKSHTRRNLAIGIIVIVAAAALVYVFTKSPPQQNRGRFGAEGGTVPVLVAPAAKADVPVYLDAVGTIKALNTVTVRPQVDGKLLSVGFKEGDDVKKGDVLARIDPTTYQAQLDQAIAKKAQELGATRQCQDRSRPLRETGGHQRHQQAAVRHPKGAGRAICRAGAIRSGGDREHAGDARLHRHRRPDRRAHRHPHGRRRQYRARLRR